jgi:Holliday junction resolvase RusA-like endonuclease
MIELVIPGEPVGKQRPKVFPMRTRTGLIIRRGVTPAKTVNYETLIRELFAVTYPGFQPLEGPLALTVEAFLLIPKSASRKKKAAMAAGEIIPEKRPDFDNLAKTAADALQGVAFRNDSQIAEAVIRKRYSQVPRMRIAIEPIGAGDPVVDEVGRRLTLADIARSQSRYLTRAAESLRTGEKQA